MEEEVSVHLYIFIYKYIYHCPITTLTSVLYTCTNRRIITYQIITLDIGVLRDGQMSTCLVCKKDKYCIACVHCVTLGSYPYTIKLCEVDRNMIHRIHSYGNQTGEQSILLCLIPRHALMRICSELSFDVSGK